MSKLIFSTDSNLCVNLRWLPYLDHEEDYIFYTEDMILANRMESVDAGILKLDIILKYDIRLSFHCSISETDALSKAKRQFLDRVFDAIKHRRWRNFVIEVEVEHG